MKRLLLVFLVLSLVLLSACAGKEVKTDDAGYADQDAFLKDMAQGISLRLNESGKESFQMTMEELSSYYLKLVGYELGKIEKYQHSTFEDATFDQLAHLYISACQAQKFAAQNYKNTELYSSLWNAGRAQRAAIITELYTHYDLPITSEQASNYDNSGSNAVSSSPGYSNEEDYSKAITIEDVEGAPICFNSNPRLSSNYHHYFKIINNADCILDVYISFRFYDAKGNLIDTRTGLYYRAVAPGEPYLGDCTSSEEFASFEYEITSVEKSFYTSGLSDLSFKMSFVNDRMILEATNNGSHTIRDGWGYCLYYNGNTLVEVGLFHFASSADPMKPGEVQHDNWTPKQTYTRYVMYYDAYYYN